MPWHCYIWRHRCSVWRTEPAIVFLCGLAENRGDCGSPSPTLQPCWQRRFVRPKQIVFLLEKLQLLTLVQSTQNIVFFLEEEIKTRKGEEVGKWTVLSDSMGTRSFFNILLQSWVLLLQCLSIYQMQTFRIIAFWKCLNIHQIESFASNIYGSSKVGLTSRLWLISIINWRIACIDFGSLPISLNHFATGWHKVRELANRVHR